MNTATKKSIHIVALLNRRAEIARMVIRGNYSQHYYNLANWGVGAQGFRKTAQAIVAAMREDSAFADDFRGVGFTHVLKALKDDRRA